MSGEPTVEPLAAAEAPAVPATAESKPAQPAKRKPKVPPGYKLVRVQLRDGSTALAKRKLTPEELAAQGDGTAKAPEETPSTAKAPEETPSTAKAPEETPSTAKTPEETPSTQPGAAANSTPTPPTDASPQPAAAKDNSKKSAAKRSSPKSAVGADSTVTTQPDKQGAGKEPTPKSESQGKGETEHAPPATAGVDMEEALHAQREQYRDAKMRRFKNTLLRGAVSVAASAIPAIEVGDMRHDDEFVSGSDSDFSIDGDEHDHDFAGDDADHNNNSDGLNNLETHHNAGHGGGDTHVTLNLSRAVGAAGTAALANSARPKQTAAEPTAESNSTAKGKRDKVTYKILEEDLHALDEKSASKLSPLKKHWANATFYILASLSVILPLLFLVLGIVIANMGGKPASSPSAWGYMPEVIKVATSAWPIVFAAVVAQMFKTWATYKVERGITLMQLEQLVSSNSFAAAVKQPLFLRSVDLLTLFLFAVWCLSPIGSSALQRTYNTVNGMVNTTTTVYYLDMNSRNRALSTQGRINLDTAKTDMYTKMSLLYQNIFIPSLTSNDNEDSFNHPEPTWSNGSYARKGPISTSNCGVPTVLTHNSIFGDVQNTSSASLEGDGKVEYVSFPMNASYFEFQCGPWSVVPSDSINASYASSQTNSLHIQFYVADGATDKTIDRMKFASVIKNGSRRYDPTALPTDGPGSLHALIDCGFDQKFVQLPVTCARTANSVTGVADCYYDPDPDVQRLWYVQEVPPESRNSSWGAALENFQDIFAAYTSPYDPGSSGSTTPNEIFLAYGRYDGIFAPSVFNLSHLATPDDFAGRMSYLFNTFVDYGNTAPYVTYIKESQIRRNETSQFVAVPDAILVYTGPLIYEVMWPWTGVYLASAALLLAAGVASVALEARTVAPDVLGYTSTVARNSRYLNLPKQKLNSTMSGGERAKIIGSTEVMMQDVKPNADVGKIALGLKRGKEARLRPGTRLYR